VATGLYKPRGIVFDAGGNLLVVQQGGGIAGVRIGEGEGGCLGVVGNETVVENANVRFN